MNGVKYPERDSVFDCWPMWYHKVGTCNISLHLSQGPNVRLLDRQGNKLFKRWQSVYASSKFSARQALEHSNLWKCGSEQTIQPLHARETLANGYCECRIGEPFQGQKPFKPTAKCTTIQLLREVLPAACRKEDKEIEGALCIIDLQGFGYMLPSSLSPQDHL